MNTYLTINSETMSNPKKKGNNCYIFRRRRIESVRGGTNQKYIRIGIWIKERFGGVDDHSIILSSTIILTSGALWWDLFLMKNHNKNQ